MSIDLQRLERGMSAQQPGDRISNYLLDACVGTGSYGSVWRAKHYVLGDVVAIKIPTDPQYVRNLRREGVVVHGLRHPNIVHVIDLDPYGDPPYLVMEYVDGPSLREAIDHYRTEFPIDAAVAIMRGVLDALSVAHARGVVHRDIKPANILLGHPLESLSKIMPQAVKVTDFGLGRVGESMTQALMQSGSLELSEGKRVAGTLAYMSPEQKDGGDVDGSSDLYSCGIVLFEMLTGERPQGRELPSALRPSVPTVLDEVFRRCYARRERRMKSTQEMRASLSADVHAPPPPPTATGRGLRCSACNATVERSDNFCIQCGQQLAASVPRCRHCAEYVKLGDLFCIRCGKSLTVLGG